MYKVMNTKPGPLSISMEKGSITLKCGGTFDIETMSSRKWIDDDAALQSLLRCEALVVVFDSTDEVPKHDLTTNPRTAVATEEEPVVTDFREVPTPQEIEDEVPEEEETTNDDFLFVMDDDDEEPEEEEPEEEEPEEEDTGKAIDPDKVDAVIEELAAMDYNQLRRVAADKYGVKTFRKSKDDVLEEIIDLLTK